MKTSIRALARVQRAVIAVVAGLAASAALMAGAHATEADGSTGQRPLAEICETFGSAPAGQYIVHNNVWGASTPQCIETTDSGFRITSADHNNATDGPPAAYPSIYAGCHYGNCTSGGGLPLQVNALGGASSNVSMTLPDSGEWNAAYDLWFDPTPRTDGQNTGAELMIWLNHRGSPQPIGQPVGTAEIAGATWEVWVGNTGWNVISYVHTSGTNSLGFTVQEFTDDAVARGQIDPAWYLTSVQVGFEPWVGGAGLAVDNFSFSAG